MIIHYLTTSFRFLRRNAVFSLINIAGLSIGLASCIVIFLYLLSELSYDRFWTHHERIFRINSSWNSEKGTARYATSPPTLVPTLLNELPEIEAATRIFKWNDFTLRPDSDSSNVFRETNVFMADENYFRVFQDRLIVGNPLTALKNPVSIVLTESAAIRYFGREFYESNVIVGRNILGGRDGGTLWQITGIMKDIPINSHQNFEILISSKTFGDEFDNSQVWTWNVMYSYVLLNEQAKSESLNEKLNSIIDRYVIPYISYSARDLATFGQPMSFGFMPLTDIHLKSNYLKEISLNGSIRLVYVFLSVAVLILLIACVNFMNLSTALSSRRAKEVGIRKSLGSHYRSLLIQFLGESVLVSLISMLMALGISELFMIYLRNTMDLQFLYTPYNSPYFIPALIFISIFAGMLASLYPSIFMSNLKPVAVLKSKAINLSRNSIRNVLVVFQFMISVGLIICVLVIRDQVEYILSKDLGFEKENVLVIQNDREIDERREEFKSRLLQYPAIVAASFSTGIPALNEFRIRDYKVEGSQTSIGFRWYEIDDSFIKTLDLDLIDGRNFSGLIASDSSGLILNEAAVAELGLTQPIGKTIIINEGDVDERKVTVLGVVKNFNYESLRREIMPLGMEFLHTYYFKDYVSIRIQPGMERAAVKIIQELWKEFEPDVPITYSFLDSNFDSMFKTEMTMEKIFKSLTGLAIFISCMGLFGLAAFSTEQKGKEIGIRKVLGASAPGIFILFSSRFIKLSSIGFLLAAPVTFYFTNEWISGFAYHSPISPWNFLIAGGITILLAILTVAYQSIKLSLVNPAEILKED
jgi:putative ABC transport system permease protein